MVGTKEGAHAFEKLFTLLCLRWITLLLAGTRGRCSNCDCNSSRKDIPSSRVMQPTSSDKSRFDSRRAPPNTEARAREEE